MGPTLDQFPILLPLVHGAVILLWLGICGAVVVELWHRGADRVRRALGRRACALPRARARDRRRALSRAKRG